MISNPFFYLSKIYYEKFENFEAQLLCQLEEPANMFIKLKDVKRMLENIEKSEGQVSTDLW